MCGFCLLLLLFVAARRVKVGLCCCLFGWGCLFRKRRWCCRCKQNESEQEHREEESKGKRVVATATTAVAAAAAAACPHINTRKARMQNQSRPLHNSLFRSSIHLNAGMADRSLHQDVGKICEQEGFSNSLHSLSLSLLPPTFCFTFLFFFFFWSQEKHVASHFIVTLSRHSRNSLLGLWIRWERIYKHLASMRDEKHAQSRICDCIVEEIRPCWNLSIRKSKR